MDTNTVQQKARPRWLWILLFFVAILILLAWLVIEIPNPSVIRASARQIADYGGNPVWSPDNECIGFYGNPSGAKPGPWIVTAGRTSQPPQFKGMRPGAAPEISWGVMKSPGTAGRYGLASVVPRKGSSDLVCAYISQIGGTGSGDMSMGIQGEILRVAYRTGMLGRAAVWRVNGGPLSGSCLLEIGDGSPNNAAPIGQTSSFPVDAESRPVWSRYGNYVAWAANGKVCVYDTRTKKLTQYPIPKGYPGFYISWSPDEKRLLYPIWSVDPAKAHKKPGDIPYMDLGQYIGYVVQEIGGKATVVTAKPGHEPFSPVWHPSGLCITYVTKDGAIEMASPPGDPHRQTKRLVTTTEYKPQWEPGKCDPYCWLSWETSGAWLAYGRANGGIVEYDVISTTSSFEEDWKKTQRH